MNVLLGMENLFIALTLISASRWSTFDRVNFLLKIGYLKRSLVNA